jgi:hypothetical protein
MAKSTSKKSARKKSVSKKSAAKKAVPKKSTVKKASAKRARKSKSARKTSTKKAARKWSGRVTRTSNALDLEPHVFEQHDASKIAHSLKHSADESKRKKGTPFQSAMSMLNFYVNRAGKNLPKTQVNVLEKAKNELRKLYGKEEK